VPGWVGIDERRNLPNELPAPAAEHLHGLDRDGDIDAAIGSYFSDEQLECRRLVADGRLGRVTCTRDFVLITVL
jgi:hypothetical protein